MNFDWAHFTASFLELSTLMLELEYFVANESNADRQLEWWNYMNMNAWIKNVHFIDFSHFFPLGRPIWQPAILLWRKRRKLSMILKFNGKFRFKGGVADFVKGNLFHISFCLMYS